MFHFKSGYLILIGKALIMAYIYLYSAANEADMREFTSPFILVMVTDEGEHYCCAVAWGHFSLASGRAMEPAKESILAGSITMA